jgi:hypothetical protein
LPFGMRFGHAKSPCRTPLSRSNLLVLVAVPISDERGRRLGRPLGLATLIAVTLLIIDSGRGFDIDWRSFSRGRRSGSQDSSYIRFSIVRCSLLIGASIASVAGALGGFHRDEV